MKEIRGIKRGVMLDPKPTKTEQLLSHDREIKNLQMSGRMTQMMLQQLVRNFETLGKDVSKAFGVITELQYKVLAMQSAGNFDMEVMTKKANELRLADFTELSDKEDAAGNFTVGDKVQNDSTVIITSTVTGDADSAGIFRSRIKLAECGVPALIQGFQDQPVGTKVTCQLNGAEHEVELLGIRNPPPAAVVEQPAVETVNVPVGKIVEEADGSQSQTYVRQAKDTVH